MNLHRWPVTVQLRNQFFVLQHFVPVSLEGSLEDLHPFRVLLAPLLGFLVDGLGLAACFALLGEGEVLGQLELYLALGDLLEEQVERAHEFVHLSLKFLTNCLVLLAGVLINLNIIIDSIDDHSKTAE